MLHVSLFLTRQVQCFVRCLTWPLGDQQSLLSTHTRTHLQSCHLSVCAWERQKKKRGIFLPSNPALHQDHRKISFHFCDFLGLPPQASKFWRNGNKASRQRHTWRSKPLQLVLPLSSASVDFKKDQMPAACRVAKIELCAWRGSSPDF